MTNCSRLKYINVDTGDLCMINKATRQKLHAVEVQLQCFLILGTKIELIKYMHRLLYSQ
jgi:hypothetical protein